MASFQPNGELYDGNGVMPDILVGKTVESYKLKRDTLLERVTANH